MVGGAPREDAELAGPWLVGNGQVPDGRTSRPSSADGTGRSGHIQVTRALGAGGRRQPRPVNGNQQPDGPDCPCHELRRVPRTHVNPPSQVHMVRQSLKQASILEGHRSTAADTEQLMGPGSTSGRPSHRLAWLWRQSQGLCPPLA